MIVVVGGHSRNIGKTAVAAGIIRLVPEARWTAVKITQHGHGVCAREGEECECAPSDPSHPYALTKETGPSSSDSGRFLAAGAANSYWLRTRAGELGHAMPVVRRILGEGENTILESNSLLNFIQPDLYLPVLDFTVQDMKESARRFLNRASALVVSGELSSEPSWPGIPARWLSAKQVFRVEPPDYESAALAEFVRERISRESRAHRPGG
ncbi:MAG: hypothetical protein FJW39_24945 [Acidobacteria bacterium]|nr:hypothetical protein [Acidobacteriota bacterium]